MITSFFNKSKPINFIIVLFVTLLAFVIARLNLPVEALTTNYILEQLTLFFIAYASILLSNFIVSKNSLTKKNNYEILLFSLFFLIIPETTVSSSILLSNFFILIALRRVISMRSDKNIKKKLFDAAFWIAIASLFHFWSILFFVLVIVLLGINSDRNMRHWIIPFLGIGTVYIISVASSVILYDTYFEVVNTSFQVSSDFSNYNSTSYLVAITLLMSFGVWSSIFYVQNIKKKKKELRSSFKTIILAAIIAFVIVVLAPTKNGSEFLFLFAPLAIIITNYIEIIEETWFKEVFVYILVIVPFFLLLL